MEGLLPQVAMVVDGLDGHTNLTTGFTRPPGALEPRSSLFPYVRPVFLTKATLAVEWGSAEREFFRITIDCHYRIVDLFSNTLTSLI